MKISWNHTCRKFKNWLRKHPGVYFTKQIVCSDLHIDDAKEQGKLYQCILYWRKKFKEFYDQQNKAGIIKGDSYQKWLLAVKNFETNYDIQPFYFDRTMHQYYVPNFADKEEISRQRIMHWIKSGETVVKEMDTFQEKMVLTGKSPNEITGDLKMIENKIMDGMDYPVCPTCGQTIQENWIACPSCGQPL